MKLEVTSSFWGLWLSTAYFTQSNRLTADVETRRRSQKTIQHARALQVHAKQTPVNQWTSGLERTVGHGGSLVSALVSATNHPCDITATQRQLREQSVGPYCDRNAAWPCSIRVRPMCFRSEIDPRQ